MRLAYIERASQLIESVLAEPEDQPKVYLNVMVPPVHKDLITELAKINRSKQAPVVRAIIDEWCEYKKRELESEG